MTTLAAEVSRLRRMTAEPGATNGYTDAVLMETLARYPVPDATGVDPVDEDGAAEAAWVPTYDLNAAAADVWTEKAAALATAYDFTADGGSFQRSQAATNARNMATYYRSRRFARGVRLKAEINPTIEAAAWVFNLPEPQD